MVVTVEKNIAGRLVSIETGKLAKQANGSVVVRCGDAVLLCTATMSKSPREGIDFFPLVVEYSEKMYSAGKIPGGFFKREARPSTDATLIARLIDRPIRPCFPDDFYHEVQVVITMLSYDAKVSPEFLGIVGASAALSVSDIPFTGPIAAALVADVDGQFVVNPGTEEIDKADLDIVVAGSRDAVLMIEAGANQVSEERILESIQVAHAAVKELVELQDELKEKAGKTKQEFAPAPHDIALDEKITAFIGSKIADNMQSGDKESVDAFLSQLQADVIAEFVDSEADNAGMVKRQYGKIKKEQIRQVIIKNKVRPDGRRLDEIRPIAVDLDVLPSGHGSAVFTRGETQSLGVVTLGTSVDEQIIDGLGDDSRSRYFFHYNFPPYSVGECGFLGRTSRRELGHGALAQRALKAVLPDYETFPYTLRLVSEILESNGSSSMASVCSGSLALMDCGVPTKAPVSGIAMGLLMDGSDYVVLSDIQGLEDHYGDMDFKVAGTRDGITALQLDIKISGLSEEILRNALAQAKEGRFHILDVMTDQGLSEARGKLSSNAPQIEFLQIDPEKVGLLIGPGGKTIRGIEEKTGATVVVMEGNEGKVSISAVNADVLQAAMNMVIGLTKDIEPGEEFMGKVVKIVDFGAFLSLGDSGKEALLHISKVSDQRIDNVADFLEVGQEVPVKVEKIDPQGRLSLVRS